MNIRRTGRHDPVPAWRRGVPARPLFLFGFAVLALGACDAAAPPSGPGTPLATAAATSVSGQESTPSSAVPASAAVVPSSSGTVLTVYFTDRHRFEAAVEPYEVPVERLSAAERAEPRAVLDAFFAGPTEEERAKGLMAVTSGFTGVRTIRIVDGVAHVFLDGQCASGGATYTISGAIRANLLPFPDIAWVKIYDQAGETETPGGQRDSIPLCLEP